VEPGVPEVLEVNSKAAGLLNQSNLPVNRSREAERVFGDLPPSSATPIATRVNTERVPLPETLIPETPRPPRTEKPRPIFRPRLLVPSGPLELGATSAWLPT